MRDLHAFNLYEHSRNSATDHLSPAIASPKEKFSYRLGRNLVFLSLAGYLIPFQVVKYLMPMDVLREEDLLTVLLISGLLAIKKQLLTKESLFGCLDGFL